MLQHMDTVFFIASKVVWAFISPDSLIVILGVGAWLAMMAGWTRLSRRLLSLCALLLIIIGSLPVGEWAIAPLENRFQANSALPANADGVIVLSGAIDPVNSEIWGQVEAGGAAERLTTFRYLAELYPGAQLVFTGGTGSLTNQEYKAADYARFLFDQLQLGERAIIYESESRNTAENASNSKALVNPEPGENWILITSAFHMPRSVGIFCQQQWPVHAYPVDHQSRTGNLFRLSFSFAENLRTLRTAVREWVGLIAYRATGRTDRFLAGDNNNCLAEQARPASSQAEEAIQD